MYFNKVSETHTHTHTHMLAFGLCAFVKPKKIWKKIIIKINRSMSYLITSSICLNNYTYHIHVFYHSCQKNKLTQYLKKNTFWCKLWTSCYMIALIFVTVAFKSTFPTIVQFRTSCSTVVPYITIIAGL